MLLALVAFILVLAGSLKIANVGAEDMLEGLEKAQLIQHKTLISITAIFSGILLLIPFTRWFGVLMATAYWGGAIVAHLTYNDAIALPAAFLVVLWMGAALVRQNNE
jgi:hypothetical protein